jgi:hypothetical protein
MRKWFEVVLNTIIVLLVLSAPARAEERKVLSHELGLSIVCLSEPFEAGWIELNKGAQYRLLVEDKASSFVDKSIGKDLRYRILVDNFPCFYEIWGQGDVSLFDYSGMFDTGPMVQVENSEIIPYASMKTLKSLVATLRTRCADGFFSFSSGSLPFAAGVMTTDHDEYCTRQVNNVLKFHSAYVNLDGLKAKRGEGLHFILGRPYFRDQEIKLWD